MHLDPLLPTLASCIAVLLVAGLVSRRVGVPYVVVYLLAGVLLGPAGLGLISDPAVMSLLGGLGIVLLLFFAGMEVSLGKLVSSGKFALAGTLLQIVLSVAAVVPVGICLAWSWERILLMGFVISISSTAVALKLLQDWRELDSPAGQSVTAILLAQDVAVIPMLIIIGAFGGRSPGGSSLALQLSGGVVCGAVMVYLATRDEIKLPIARLEPDHELQVMVALAVCFGAAMITGLLHLSTALGGFIAGLLIASARETRWFHDTLLPMKVVFLAIFFLSVGMLIDLPFLRSQWPVVMVIVLLALLTNTLINAATLRVLGLSWRSALYAGTLLAQIGEFSFLLVTVGLETEMISDFGYQLAMTVIFGSLLVGPFWVQLGRRLFRPSQPPGTPGVAASTIDT